MSTDELLFEKNEQVAWIRFNRPQAHNAATVAMYDALDAALAEIEQDDQVRVVILRGEGGKAFVAGTDISHFRNFTSDDDAIGYERRIDQIVGRLEALPCTTVAVIDGVCAGGGVALALACDFRYANTKLKFGIPISKTLGNCLSVTNLARAIDYLGITKTKEMLMLGKMFTADEAYALNVVNYIGEPEALDDAVEALIQELLSVAPLTLQAVKLGMQRTLEERRAPQEASDDYIKRCYTSEDFHGAVEAFLEKRRYSWKGK